MLFDAFLPFTCFMFDLFFRCEYQLTETGYIKSSSSLETVFRFVFHFRWYLLSCVMFVGESLLPCSPMVGSMEYHKYYQYLV